jgi:hypothetical protein
MQVDETADNTGNGLMLGSCGVALCDQRRRTMTENETGPTNKIQIEHKGKTYSGLYFVKGDKVTVASKHGYKVGRRGALPPQEVAEIMLRELVIAPSYVDITKD